MHLIFHLHKHKICAFDNIILPGFDDDFDGIIDDSSETESESKSNDKKTEDYAPAVGEEKQLQTHEADDSIYQTTLGSVTEEEFLRLPCFCHCLQLLVNDGIKASAAAVSSLQKVASLAKLSHSSTVFSERLEKFNYTIPRANRTR
ncbi:unnamed protein product, partial [Adineta steineri]